MVVCRKGGVLGVVYGRLRDDEAKARVCSWWWLWVDSWLLLRLMDQDFRIREAASRSGRRLFFAGREHDGFAGAAKPKPVARSCGSTRIPVTLSVFTFRTPYCVT